MLITLNLGYELKVCREEGVLPPGRPYRHVAEYIFCDNTL